MSSESLDSTPNPVKSPELRDDRMSAGTKVLSSATAGGLNGMWVRDTTNDVLVGCGMYNNMTAAVAMAADTVAVDAVLQTLTFATADPSATFAIGDVVQLSGFVESENNTTVVVTAVDATSITYAGGAEIIDTAGAGAEVATHPAYWEIGKVKRSVSLEKTYTDMGSGADHNIDYTGNRIDTIEWATSYAEYATMNFGSVGASTETLPAANDEMTFGRVIDPASTREALNSTDDLDMILVDGQEIECGFSSLSISLNNNHTARNKLGKVTPCDQQAHSASITVDAVADFTAGNAPFLREKLSMPKKVVYMSIADGSGVGYALRVSGAQLTTSDPAAGGQDQETQLNLSGEGAIGANGENALRIYGLGTI